jgi:septum formation protein
MLANKLKDYNVILASGSPRRQQFFKDLNIDFSIQLKEVFTNLSKKDLLITSDTIVWLENKALGKPKNKEEAIAMLQSLSGKAHKVITSISIKSKHFQKIINDTTFVYFKEITNDEIGYYVDNYQPFDKAGAYGIQEWIGLIAIKKIEGSYFNVVGLPTEKLYKELIQL